MRIKISLDDDDGGVRGERKAFKQFPLSIFYYAKETSRNHFSIHTTFAESQKEWLTIAQKNVTFNDIARNVTVRERMKKNMMIY
jgi:hypothetical protein